MASVLEVFTFRCILKFDYFILFNAINCVLPAKLMVFK